MSSEQAPQQLWSEKEVYKQADLAAGKVEKREVSVMVACLDVLFRMRNDWKADRATLTARVASPEQDHSESLSYIDHLQAREAEMERTLKARIAELEQELETFRGDDWAKTVEHLMAHAPEPEPDYDVPEPPEDYDDEDEPHYDTPGGF